jgi:hypothetical protein
MFSLTGFAQHSMSDDDFAVFNHLQKLIKVELPKRFGTRDIRMYPDTITEYLDGDLNSAVILHKNEDGQLDSVFLRFYASSETDDYLFHYFYDAKDALAHITEYHFESGSKILIRNSEFYINPMGRMQVFKSFNKNGDLIRGDSLYIVYNDSSQITIFRESEYLPDSLKWSQIYTIDQVMYDSGGKITSFRKYDSYDDDNQNVIFKNTVFYGNQQHLLFPEIDLNGDGFIIDSSFAAEVIFYTSSTLLDETGPELIAYDSYVISTNGDEMPYKKCTTTMNTGDSVLISIIKLPSAKEADIVYTFSPEGYLLTEHIINTELNQKADFEFDYDGNGLVTRYYFNIEGQLEGELTYEFIIKDDRILEVINVVDEDEMKYVFGYRSTSGNRSLPVTELQAYPNPVNQEFNIKLPAGAIFPIVQCINESGQIVEIPFETQFDLMHFQTGALINGAYKIQILINGKVYNSRFIKSR